MATEREIELVCDIQRLAIRVNMQRKFNIWTDFSGHVNSFEVTISPPWVAGVNTIGGWGSGDKNVYLSTDYKISTGENIKDVIEDKVSQLAIIKEELIKFLEVDADGIPL